MYQKHKAKSIKTQNNERKNETFARGPKARLCLYCPRASNQRKTPRINFTHLSADFHSTATATATATAGRDAAVIGP
jgi:hypothetical protein